MKKIIGLTFLAILFYMVFTETSKLRLHITEGTGRCLNVVVPSLFFIMAVSNIAVRSGLLNIIAPAFDRFSRLVFKMNGVVFLTFVMGMFAGYPVGARMLSEHYTRGLITKKQFNTYVCVCFGAGPAFVFGCIGSPQSGKLVILSTVAANVIMCFVTSISLERPLRMKKISSKEFTASEFCESVTDAGKALLQLCVMIVFFSCFAGYMPDKVNAVLDVTSISGMNIYSASLLPLVSFCISFGGVCVIMQIKSMLGENINLLRFIVMRTVTGFLSMTVCYLLLPLFTVNNAVPSSSNSETPMSVAAGSPMAAVMLVIMLAIIVMEAPNYNLTKKDLQ